MSIKLRACHCAGGLSSLSDGSKTRFMRFYRQVDENELSVAKFDDLFRVFC